MELIDKIIDDSALLIKMRNNEPEFFINITIEKLSDYINNMNNPYLTNIIDRIKPLYEGIYPDNVNDVLKFIKDLDFLESKKRFDLFVIIHFSNRENDILKELNDTLNYEYQQIDFKETEKKTIISLGLVDLLISKNYCFYYFDFYFACKYGHLSVIKYIYDDKLDYNKKDEHCEDILENFADVCSTGNLELVKYIWNIQLPIEQIYNGNTFLCIYYDAFEKASQSGNIKLIEWLYYLGLKIINIYQCLDDDKIITYNNYTFIYSCKSGNIELVKCLYDLILKSNGEIDIHFANELAFQNACKSGNLELVQWLWNFDEKINIHEYDDLAFNHACKSGNLKLVQWLWELGLEIESKDGTKININSNELFSDACRSGNLELVQWLWKLSLEIESKGGTRINTGFYYSFLQACRSGNLELVQWLYLILENNTIVKNVFTDFLFNACMSKNLELVKWLYNLFITNGEIIDIRHIISCTIYTYEITKWLNSKIE